MPDAFPLPPLQPTRDPRVTLPDLLEVLLNKGVVLHLDLIIAVADIPLIGVSLKAAVAGIETMLEYGMMRQWDEQTRAWVQRSISRNVPFEEGEELIARMGGGHEQVGLYTTWRPGTLYLTDRRLFVFRREPREMLWEARLEQISAAESEPDRSVGGDDRKRLRVTLNDGDETRLSAAEPERMLSLVREQVQRLGRALTTASPRLADAPDSLLEGQVWFHEPRAGGGVWRGGLARADRRNGLSWKSPLDTRPAVMLSPNEVRGLRLESGRTPTGSRIMVVETSREEVRLAADDLDAWIDAVLELLESCADAAVKAVIEGMGVEDGADG